MTKTKPRQCRAAMDTENGSVVCVRESGHGMPHRTDLISWYNPDDDSNLGKRYAEWTKPRGKDAELVRRKSQGPGAAK